MKIIERRMLALEQLRLYQRNWDMIDDARQSWKEHIDKIPSIDSVAQRTLDQAVKFYGIRAVVLALRDIADARARVAGENFNMVLAKQWAQWGSELQILADNCSLYDPGRE